MSVARAKAKDPIYKDAFFDKKEALYKKHYDEGILTTLNEQGKPEPDSDQVFSGDEMGYNPSGKNKNKVVCSLKRGHMHVITQGEGGKATFWVTIFYWCRADGQLPIPPFIVHEGGVLNGMFAMYLPSDWGVHAAPFGYMDRDGWFKVCTHFQKHCGPKRPLYPVIDGHDSHWDSAAMKMLYDVSYSATRLSSSHLALSTC